VAPPLVEAVVLELQQAQGVVRVRESESRPVAVEASVPEQRWAREGAQLAVQAQESESQPVPAEARRAWQRAQAWAQ
jgi:hypothetical protein